jgi:hypothetical protein
LFGKAVYISEEVENSSEIITGYDLVFHTFRRRFLYAKRAVSFLCFDKNRSVCSVLMALGFDDVSSHWQ